MTHRPTRSKRLKSRFPASRILPLLGGLGLFAIGVVATTIGVWVTTEDVDQR